MIWVNDFFTLTEVPKWLEHASATEDYLGFSDVIFPLFLFIVGLSIPFAIRNRKASGSSDYIIGRHIVIRSLSLLLIGVFMVNYETAHHESIAGGKYLWGLLMATAVMLLWMNWKKSPLTKKQYVLARLTGLLLLIILVFLYRGGDDGSMGMRTHWWGILGLIGWAYLVNALVHLWSKGNWILVILMFVIFNGLAVLSHSGILQQPTGMLSYFSVIYQGSIPAFTAAGVLAGMIMDQQSNRPHLATVLILVLLGLGCLVYGIAFKPIWGISKIQATPAWVGICTGIGFLMTAILYIISDMMRQTNWAKIIMPAGTATLTCYMIPYFVYPLREMIPFRLPQELNRGFVGLLVSLGFALGVVLFTGWMERKNYKLKI